MNWQQKYVNYSVEKSKKFTIDRTLSLREQKIEKA